MTKIERSLTPCPWHARPRRAAVVTGQCVFGYSQPPGAVEWTAEKVKDDVDIRSI